MEATLDKDHYIINGRKYHSAGDKLCTFLPELGTVTVNQGCQVLVLVEPIKIDDKGQTIHFDWFYLESPLSLVYEIRSIKCQKKCPLSDR